MSTSFVQFAVNRGVARLTLNRPDKRNALTQEFIRELSNYVSSTAANESIRLLVVAAEGKAFCAGMDLQQMQDRAAAPNATELWQADTQVYRDLLVELTTLPIPTLAVVDGPALAGGLGLVLASDLVIASELAVFGLPEPKRGITAAVVAPLLIHRVGISAATHLLLSGKTLNPADAFQIGLCHNYVPTDELTSYTESLTASILTGARSALSITKQQILDFACPHLIERLDAGMAASAAARETDDAREGLAAFLEKRTPSWQPDRVVPAPHPEF